MPAMSLEDSKYVWVKVEPPWESTALHEPFESAQTNIDHVVNSKNELKSEVACDVSVAARTGLYLNEVKVEFESESKKGVSNASTETTLALNDVKEAESEKSCGVSDASLYLKHEVKTEAEGKESLYFTNEVNPEWNSEGLSGVSDAAAKAGLYLKHEVKNELVVGPEVFQRPKVLAVWSESPNVVEDSVLDRTCSVKLERMHVDMEHHICRIGGEFYKFHSYLQGNDTGINIFKKQYQCGEQSESSTTSLSSENALNDLLEEKLYRCTYCSFTSVYKKYIRVHKTIAHVGEKPHKCNECEYACYNKYALQAHINTVHASVYKCDHCSYSSAHKNGLKIHKQVHKGDKSYHCDQCDYSCNRKNNLTHHKWVHSKEKPFKCNYCDYANARKYELQAHINAMHRSDHVYRCEQCNYATVRKDKLVAHKRMHSFASASKDYSHVLIDTENKYKCDRCSYESVREDLLEIHKNMMHANESKIPLVAKPRRSSTLEIHKNMMHAHEKPRRSSKRIRTKDKP